MRREFLVERPVPRYSPHCHPLNVRRSSAREALPSILPPSPEPICDLARPFPFSVAIRGSSKAQSVESTVNPSRDRWSHCTLTTVPSLHGVCSTHIARSRSDSIRGMKKSPSPTTSGEPESTTQSASENHSFRNSVRVQCCLAKHIDEHFVRDLSRATAGHKEAASVNKADREAVQTVVSA